MSEYAEEGGGEVTIIFIVMGTIPLIGGVEQIIKEKEIGDQGVYDVDYMSKGGGHFCDNI